ncbi:hypothetical protein [Halorubrum ezzemoulense]|nr:hypothetical protein [Halorubrum ezzemoulense]MDB9299166.1 hypothetical protein [Halorubrum ezzemoulense]
MRASVPELDVEVGAVINLLLFDGVVVVAGAVKFGLEVSDGWFREAVGGERDMRSARVTNGAAAAALEPVEQRRPVEVEVIGLRLCWS